MKRKLLKFIRKLQSKSDKLKNNKEIDVIVTPFEKIIIFSIDFFYNIFSVIAGAFIINLMLILLNYDLTIKTFLGCVGFYFVVYEVKSWIDKWRIKE